MTRAQIPSDLASNAGWLVQALDPKAGLCRLVKMDAATYRAASFLDDRILPDVDEQRIVAMGAVLEVGRTVSNDDANWIFHIGHVGSTLVSRLLGELDGTLSLREPRSLRDLAAFSNVDLPHKATSLRRLMARRLSDTDRVIVKATSFTSEFGKWLVGPSARVALLFASPRNYIASILAGPNSTVELRSLEPHRMVRLSARGFECRTPYASDAHRAAAAWLCEMASLDAVATDLGDRAAWFDFDRMLGDMTGALRSCAVHFGAKADDRAIQEAVAGPLMRKYSKAMEFDYSPALRAELLSEAMTEYRQDMDQAIAWLAEQAANHSVAASALARAHQEI